MSDYIKREDATAVIRKTLGSLGNSVVTEINSLSGYATQDHARVTQESTQDLISREDAREAIEKLMDIHFDRQVVLAKARDAIVSLPSAECDDCIWHVCNHNKVDWDGEDGYISKRDALAEFRDGRDVYDIMESIEELPSAEPKTGKWIFNTGEHTLKSFFICSECGGSIFHESNYCPNCGAKMEGGEEE